MGRNKMDMYRVLPGKKGHGLGVVCDHINYFGYHMKEI